MARRLPPEARALRLPTIRCPAAYSQNPLCDVERFPKNSFQPYGSRSSAGWGSAVGDRTFSSRGMWHGPDRSPTAATPGNKTSCDCLSSQRNNHSSCLSATARARHITARRNRSKRYGRRHSQQSPVAIGSPCNALPIISLFMTIVKRFVTHYGIGICSSTAEGPDATRCTAGAMTGTHILWCVPRAGFGAKPAPGTRTHRPNK